MPHPAPSDFPVPEAATTPPRAAWAVWHLATAAAIALGASHLRLATPLWALTSDRLVFLAAVAVTHLAAAVTHRRMTPGGSGTSARAAAVAVAAGYAALSVGLLMAGTYHSRSVLPAAAMVSFGTIAAGGAFLGSRGRILIPSLLAGVAGLALVGLRLHPGGEGAPPPVEHRSLSTAFYELALTIHHGIVPSAVDGGGVEALENGLLVAAGDGALYFVTRRPAGAISAERLPFDVPLNRAAFQASAPDDVSPTRFRVTDVLALEAGDSVAVFAAHHFWRERERCFVLRVSAAAFRRDGFPRTAGAPTWRTVHDTEPCLPLKTDTTEAPFSGHQAGGRLALQGDGTLLLTVGDHAFDGVNSPDVLPQDPRAQYGKTLRLDLGTGTAEILTSGHRNPQGLHVTGDGRIWLTDHGPQGGDELNLVRAGANYGWPFVVYGTEYGAKTWPLSVSEGRHPDFERPVFAWTPSIGISNLTSIRGDRFPLWRGDLLIGTLGSQQLLRTRVVGNRVVFAEPVPAGLRIRDLTETRSGRIVLLIDGGSLAWIEPGAPPADSIGPKAADPVAQGRLVFATCRNCHVPEARMAADGRIPLGGVVGRRVASVSGVRYSPALAAVRGSWTEERLDRFLANPAAEVPGTFMVFEGVSDPALRAALIRYLATLH